MKDISFVIQAGGKSSRMGTDKGLVKFKSKPLIQFIIDQIQQLSDDIFIISNSPDKYNKFRLPVFEDEYKNIGPLAGLHFALSNSKYQNIVNLGCDMPFVNIDLINFMAKFISDYDVVIPEIKDGKLEPFMSIYSKNCFSYIENSIKKNEKRMISFFDHVKVKIVKRKEIELFGDPEVIFMNINTKNDLEFAENIHWRK